MAARASNPDLAVELLDRLGAAAAAGEPVPAEAAQWLIAGVARWHQGEPLDKALGLARGRGQRKPETIAGLRRGNLAIGALRDRFFGDLGITRAADEIARKGGKYETTAWRFDRARPVAAIADEEKRLLAEVLSTRSHFPRRRQVENILRATNSPAFDCAKDAVADPHAPLDRQ